MRQSFASEDPYLLATVLTVPVFACLPLALYIAAAFASNDLGGPLNCVIIPGCCGVVAIPLALFVWLPVSVLGKSVLKSRLHLKWWLQVPILFLAYFIAGMAVSTIVRALVTIPVFLNPLEVGAVGGVFIALCGLWYWIVLTWSERRISDTRPASTSATEKEI